MANIKLTTKGVIKLSPINGKRTEYWDAMLPGFGLRVTSNEKKSWVLMYRVNNRKRRMTLGRYPSLGLADARIKARSLLEQVDLGEDPAIGTQQEESDGPLTFKKLGEDFIERHCKPNKKSWLKDAQALERDVYPDWGNRPADSIKKSDVIRLLEKKAKVAPIAANRILSLCRKVFNWAIEKDLLELTPFLGVKAPAKERARKRVLKPDEIKKIWNATEKMGSPWKVFYRVVLLTMQRVDEVAGMCRSEIDWKESEWLLEGNRTKNSEGNTIPLPTLVVELLKSVEDYGSDEFFPARGREIEGGRHISGLSKSKARLDKLSGVTDWVVHDFRRTGATYLAKLKTPPHIIEKVLNHVAGEIKGVALIYNRYGYIEEKRQALDLWESYVDGLISGKSQKVVPLRRNEV